MKKILISFVALLAIAATAMGPARAQESTYTVSLWGFDGSSYNWSYTNYTLPYELNYLSPGDVIGQECQSFTNVYVSSGGDGKVSVNYNTNSMSLTVTGAFEGTATIHCEGTNENGDVSRDVYVVCTVPQMYTSEVSITSLVEGDTLAEGATITGRGNYGDQVSLDFGRTKENGVVPSFWTNLYQPPTVIGTNGTISGTYTPVDGNGQDGNAWVVTNVHHNDYDGIDVSLGGIIIPVYRTLDSIPMGWTVKVGEAAAVSPTAYTDGGSATKGFLQVEQGQPVVLVPSAEDKPRVKSVTLAEEEESVTLATPLSMEALTAGTIVVDMSSSSLTMKYSKNGGAKTTITATTTINVAAGDKVQFYGDGTNNTSYYGIRISGGTASVKVYGNVMSLVDEENFATATTLSDYAFGGLFDGNATLTDASELLLPATTLAYNCYSDMFYGCIALTTAPALPATTLAEKCYYEMFMECGALTTAPELPATTLAEWCYYGMFWNCSALSSVTCLATDISASRCLTNWLKDAGFSATSPTLHVKASMGSASWNNENFTVEADQ